MEWTDKPECITHEEIPDDIRVAVRKAGRVEQVNSGEKPRRQIEKEYGRKLAEDLVRMTLGPEPFEISAKRNQKPTAAYNGLPVEISIAHCSGLVGCAMSKNRAVGIDLEPVDRKTNPGLRERIVHPTEIQLLGDLSSVQIWTLKESALKWSGTGLRRPMREICIREIRKPLFFAEFSDGKFINICNLQYRSYWVSIAFD